MGKKEVAYYPNLGIMKRGKHATFDEMYKKWNKMIFHQAHKYAKTFQIEYENVLGFCVLKFNECLHLWNEEKGSFSRYYYSAIGLSFQSQFMRYESESRNCRYYHWDCSLRNSPIRFSIHDSAYVGTDEDDDYCVNPPARQEYVLDVERKQFWSTVKSILTEDEFAIITMRFIDNMNDSEIAQLYKCSRSYIPHRVKKIYTKLREAGLSL